MLTSLSIYNYALISRLEINFSSGFSVLTGETGAGKSIILGALSLILGQRADVKSIKHDADKCLIEGVFDISSYDLQSYFQEKDLDYDEKYCILRRELWASGKSRAFINDIPVGLNDLKELGGRLIDVHSQHQNLMLADGLFQLQVLDALAGNHLLKNRYREAYLNYTAIQKQLKQLTEDAANNASEGDYLQYQYKQLDEARLRAGEQQELESESEMLSHVEEIKSGLYQIEQILSDEESGVVLALKNSLNTAQTLTKVYTQSGEIAERIQSAYLDLKDLALSIASQQEGMEFDPERLQFVNERLDLIYSLQQKHKVNSLEELIELRDGFEKKLNVIGNLDEELEQLRGKLKVAESDMMKEALQVTLSRRQSALRLERELVEKVKVLGMPNMKFAVELSPRLHPDPTGIDNVDFLFSANKNIPLKPVAQTASGGEISRLMLGVKALIAGAMALPAIIFDEIDTGVSGEIADKMGDIMQELGDVMQVIAITHLPQIAAKGRAHYFVYKEDLQDTTETQIRQLSDEERINEIAHMLSGSELSDAALANAKNLLKI